VCVCVCVCVCVRALTVTIPEKYMQSYMLYFSTVRLRHGQETFLRNVQTRSGVHPASYSMSSGVSSRVKRPGRNVYHSHSCSAEVKNDWTHRVYSKTPYAFMASTESTSLGNVEEIVSNVHNGNR
jgi:hypothetical protein